MVALDSDKMISVADIKKIILINFSDYVEVYNFNIRRWNEDYDCVRYTCKTCGISYEGYGKINNWEKDRIVHHIIRKHKGLFIADLIKPWEDEDSLFCSPKLKEIIGKEPLTSNECRTNKRRII